MHQPVICKSYTEHPFFFRRQSCIPAQDTTLIKGYAYIIEDLQFPSSLIRARTKGQKSYFYKKELQCSYSIRGCLILFH